MPFTDLHELRDEMDGFTDHEKVDASHLDKIAGQWRHDREWLSRDWHIPKTKFQVRAERWAARAARALPSDPDELRLLLYKVRQEAGRREVAPSDRPGAKLYPRQGVRHRE